MSSRARTIGLLFLAALAASAHAPSPARGATVEQVGKAIDKGKALLYARMKGDNWEVDPAPTDDGQASVTGKQWGGLTAIATYALLAAGENPRDERIVGAVEWLREAPIGGHYAVGLRAQVWTYLPERDARRASTTDFLILLNSLLVDQRRLGLYSYYTDLETGKPQPTWWDHSVSQYGVLGMWACEQAGQEVPSRYWEVVDARWRNDQLKDGSWSYRTEGTGRGTMAAAGIATLFITQDHLLFGRRWRNCDGGRRDPHIEKGLAWMDRNGAAMLRGGAHYYYGLYGIERIGAASGRKYFGDTDWYRVGADELVKKQKPDGSWGDGIPDTCFALLFLARGRAPVVMNKLEYVNAPDPARPNADRQEVPWNERPRDVAHFAHWSGKQLEQHLNWQVVNLGVPADLLQDAPILYVAGSESLNLTDEQVAKLREYALEGGLILGNADCASRGFADSFRDLGRRMFPMYDFRELPPDHVIYTGQQYRPSRWRVKPRVEALGNGVRELMVLIPTADAGRAWQTRSELTRREVYELVQNLFLYAVDKSDLRFRGDTHIVNPDPAVKAKRHLKVARLDVGDNPDPEPAGWRRLAAVLHNQHALDVSLVHVKPGDGKLKASAAKLAHLTGTTGFTLTPEQRQELKDFVDGGGTLVVDAAGGNPVFAEAAEAELAATFSTPVLDFGTRLPPDHPLYAREGARIERFAYRDFARGRLTGKLNTPRLRGLERDGRLAVLFSREDLTAGLVGQPVDGILGYAPETATAIVRNIALWVGGR